MRRLPPLLLIVVALAAVHAPAGYADASHAGWPQITGMLLMNKTDGTRPLDGRPGQDPFDAADRTYSCDEIHQSTHCFASYPERGFVSVNDPDGHHTYDYGSLTDNIVPQDIGHNELLGGHGDNTIHAGPAGDVIWGDYKPSGDPVTQVNHLYGGPGDDFIYAAHGTSYIWTGGGVDVVHAHYGHGVIHCESPTVTVFLSHKSRPHYTLDGCTHISYALDPNDPAKYIRH